MRLGAPARAPALLLAAVASVAACTEVDEVDEVEVAADGVDGKADATAELKVRAGDTSVWVQTWLVRGESEGRPAYLLRGRTSRNLTDGNVYIFDDVYGEFLQRGPRSFELVWTVSTPVQLLEGVQMFNGLGFVHSEGRPDHLTARLVVRPRIDDTSGSSALYLTAEVTPVIMDGTVVYRVQGRARAAITSVTATAAGAPVEARAVDPTHFVADLTRAQVLALAGVSGADLVFQVGQGTGVVSRRAHLGLAVKKLGLTAADAYDTWPVPTCTAAAESCLLALPAGALDLASCGDAVTTRACAREVGVGVDSASIAAAQAAAETTLGSAAFTSDAGGLVGVDRASELVSATRTAVTSALAARAGRWYLSADTRAAVLTAAATAPIDRAYARPLTLVAPRPLVADEDAAALRQRVADAILVHLGGLDLAATALGRSYDTLTRELRAQHVAGLRQFREVVTPAPDTAHPGLDLYQGDWLGLYLEASVDRSSRAITRVFLEID